MQAQADRFKKAEKLRHTLFWGCQISVPLAVRCNISKSICSLSLNILLPIFCALSLSHNKTQLLLSKPDSWTSYTDMFYLIKELINKYLLYKIKSNIGILCAYKVRH